MCIRDRGVGETKVSEEVVVETLGCLEKVTDVSENDREGAVEMEKETV